MDPLASQPPCKVLNEKIPAGKFGRYLTVSEVERLRACGVTIRKPTRVIRATSGIEWNGNLNQSAGHGHSSLGVRVSTQ
jgi:hypothetical protein